MAKFIFLLVDVVVVLLSRPTLLVLVGSMLLGSSVSLLQGVLLRLLAIDISDTDAVVAVIVVVEDCSRLPASDTDSSAAVIVVARGTITAAVRFKDMRRRKRRGRPDRSGDCFPRRRCKQGRILGQVLDKHGILVYIKDFLDEEP